MKIPVKKWDINQQKCFYIEIKCEDKYFCKYNEEKKYIHCSWGSFMV